MKRRDLLIVLAALGGVAALKLRPGNRGAPHDAYFADLDALLAQDTSGKLLQLMNETVDGEYQNFKAKGGAYTREKFFGKYPETARLVAHMSDDEIAGLQRGGHDPHKVYAAYAAAVAHTGTPTVILAKTIKGYGLGSQFAGRNATHQMKKLSLDDLKALVARGRKTLGV